MAKRVEKAEWAPEGVGLARIDFMYWGEIGVGR